MLKRYRFWLWFAVVILLLNVLIHTVTLFIQPAPQDETQRQLFDLMANYKHDFGAGFVRSTKDLVTALSSCMSFLCLLGGLTLAFLLRKKVDVRLTRGIVGIHVLVFGICFAVIVVFTFLVPIVLIGLVFTSLLLSYFLIPREPQT